MGSRSKDRGGYHWPYGHASQEARAENRKAWESVASEKNQKLAKRKAKAIRKRLEARASRHRKQGQERDGE